MPLVKLYVEEEDRELVVRAVAESEMVATSTIAYAEARATFARKRREGNLDDEGHEQAVSDLCGDWPAYARLYVSDLLSYRAGDLAQQHALRGYDAIHLASALRLGESFEDLSFLAFDGSLTRRRAGGVPDHLRRRDQRWVRDIQLTRRWVEVREAAGLLEIIVGAVRKRFQRGTPESEQEAWASPLLSLEAR